MALLSLPPVGRCTVALLVVTSLAAEPHAPSAVAGSQPTRDPTPAALLAEPVAYRVYQRRDGRAEVPVTLAARVKDASIVSAGALRAYPQTRTARSPKAKSAASRRRALPIARHVKGRWPRAGITGRPALRR